MFNLSGKTALVTGATGGIGGSIARSLHAQGAMVALSGTRKEVLDQLAAELGERAFVVPADLSNAESVEALVPAAEAAMGSVDILVNNAGLTRDGLFMRMKDEDWDLVLRVNLDAAFRLSRAAIRGMMKKRWGRIVTITSVVGTTGNAGQAYRMYQAAFARTPDKTGVSFWVNQVDKGLSLHDLGQSFISSAEFKGIYGANPNVSTLVTGFYTNVLGRPPDSVGLNFWVGQVQSGMSTADLLVSFSESTENKAHVAPAIQNGIELSLSLFG